MKGYGVGGGKAAQGVGEHTCFPTQGQTLHHDLLWLFSPPLVWPNYAHSLPVLMTHIAFTQGDSLFFYRDSLDGGGGVQASWVMDKANMVNLSYLYFFNSQSVLVDSSYAHSPKKHHSKNIQSVHVIHMNSPTVALIPAILSLPIHSHISRTVTYRLTIHPLTVIQDQTQVPDGQGEWVSCYLPSPPPKKTHFFSERSGNDRKTTKET